MLEKKRTILNGVVHSRRINLMPSIFRALSGSYLARGPQARGSILQVELKETKYIGHREAEMGLVAAVVVEIGYGSSVLFLVYERTFGSADRFRFLVEPLKKILMLGAKFEDKTPKDENS